jgi:hypothetical protein
MEKSAGGILDVGVRSGWGIDTTSSAVLSSGKHSDHTFHKFMEGPQEGHEHFPEEKIPAFFRASSHDSMVVQVIG